MHCGAICDANATCYLWGSIDVAVANAQRSRGLNGECCSASSAGLDIYSSISIRNIFGRSAITMASFPAISVGGQAPTFGISRRCILPTVAPAIPASDQRVGNASHAASALTCGRVQRGRKTLQVRSWVEAVLTTIRDASARDDRWLEGDLPANHPLPARWQPPLPCSGYRSSGAQVLPLPPPVATSPMRQRPTTRWSAACCGRCCWRTWQRRTTRCSPRR